MSLPGRRSPRDSPPWGTRRRRRTVRASVPVAAIVCLLWAGTGAPAEAPASAPAASPAAGAVTAWDVPLIPRTVLFGNPERTAVRLAPDGLRIGFVAPVDGVQNVWVGPVGGEARPITHDTHRGVHRYAFAYDNRRLLYLQDAAGDENWRLYGVDLETGETTAYTPFENVQVQLIAAAQRVPNTVLIAMNKTDPRRHDVYRLNLTTGALTRVAENPGDVGEWVVDPELRVLGAVRIRADGGQECLVRANEEADWTVGVRWSLDDSAMSEPVAFMAGGRTLILKDSRTADTTRLVTLDLDTGATTVLAADPTYDIRNVMLQPETFAAQAVAVVRDRLEWRVLDEALRDDFLLIRAIARGNLSIGSRDAADRTWLVAFRRDTGSTRYYLYDRDMQLARFLFADQPALDRFPLAPMEPVTITARDGLTLHGYVTFPLGRERRAVPMVLLVHGGPWSRDAWGYHSTAQWLANRGYVCLQVNFRGSTGYGKAFLNAGNREWGGAMHDDLVDAVRWAVAEGIAAPDRIGIMGASYGGYAALVGATRTPEVFACAVDTAGPSNLVTLLRSIPPYWEPFRAVWQQRIGDPDADAEFLYARSPLSRVDRITIPLFIVQGANDPRVKQAEAEQIVAALRARGIPYEYLLFPDEGHGLAKPENRLRATAAIELFLARHLGGRAEPAPSGTP